MTKRHTINLLCTWRLRAPLSHIGESISADQYLVEMPVVQDDGAVATVGYYSGNALRGQIRDLAAATFFEVLNLSPRLPAFHLLTSGGSIKGDQKIDIARQRQLRDLLPPVSLLGGGIGTTMLPGNIAFGIAWPVCQETRHIVEHALPSGHVLPTYGELLAEVSYTRRDDSKTDSMTRFIAQQIGAEEEKVTQMRFTSELLAAGTVLVSRINLVDCTDVEVGVFVDALARFHKQPFLGGQRARGHGEASFVMSVEGGQPFVTGGSGQTWEESPEAQAFHAAYTSWCAQVNRAEVEAALESIC
jgi:hypothetical protein